MGITSGDLASSGNGLINPFSTASVPVENPVENLVEMEAGSDPIENLLPALLQIFLTVRLLTSYFILSLATLHTIKSLGRWVVVSNLRLMSFFSKL